jgi:CBF1 interacting corepressor
MVQGLKFLSKKGFNPQNQVNQKNVWEREHASKNEQERVRQRGEQLRRERDDEELARARAGERGGSQAQLRFMYDAPPGSTGEQKEQQEQTNNDAAKPSTSAGSLTQIQPGDDAAAAAFRRMLAGQCMPEEGMTKNEEQEDTKVSFGPVLQGSDMEKVKAIKPEGLSALEKAVGRRDKAPGLSLAEQMQRFPQLKNAPMAKGMSDTNVNVAFKPLGAELRNVKCLACGIWGHSKGDRECKTSGWDPFSGRTTMPVAQSSSIRPVETPKEIPDKDAATKSRTKYSEEDDKSVSSSSSSSDDSSRKKSRKHRKSSRKKKRKHRHESSSSRRRRRSESPDRKRSRSRKSSHKKRKHDL